MLLVLYILYHIYYQCLRNGKFQKNLELVDTPLLMRETTRS